MSRKPLHDAAGWPRGCGPLGVVGFRACASRTVVGLRAPIPPREPRFRALDPIQAPGLWSYALRRTRTAVPHAVVMIISANVS